MIAIAPGNNLFTSIKYLLCLVSLFILDVALAVHRMGRSRYNILFCLLGSASTILLIWNMGVMIRINGAAQSMSGQVLTSMSTTISLGRRLSDIQAELVMMKDDDSRVISSKTVEEFDRNFRLGLAEFPRNVHSELHSDRERGIFISLNAAYIDYISALKGLEGRKVASREWLETFKIGQHLRVILRDSTTNQVAHLQNLTDGVRDDIKRVFVVLCVLGGVVSIMIGLWLSMIVFTRMLED